MDENVVKLYVWYSAGSNSLGHVALETFCDIGLGLNNSYDEAFKRKSGNGIYVSFWPENVCAGKCGQNRASSHLHTYVQDLIVEQRPPEEPLGTVITLNQLNVSHINAEFHKISFAVSRGEIFWALSGSSILGWVLDILNGKRKTRSNCVGLCYHLLTIGGIKHPKYYFSDYFADTSLIREIIRTLSIRLNLTTIALGLDEWASSVASESAYGLAIDKMVNPSGFDFRPTLITAILELIVTYAFHNTISPPKEANTTGNLPILAMLIPFGRYFTYSKTITPQILMDICEYAKGIENGVYSDGTSYVQIPKFGFVARDKINLVLAIMNGLASAYLILNASNIKRMPDVYKNSRNYLALDHFITNSAKLYLSCLDKKMLSATLLTSIFFVRSGFKNSRGLLGITLSVINALCSDNYFFMYGPLIFYLSNKLAKYFEKICSTEGQASDSLITKVSRVFTPNRVNYFAHLVVAGIGFFCAKRLSSPNHVTQPLDMQFKIKR